MVVANFSGEKLERIPITFPRSGTCSVLLNTDDAKYGRDFIGVTTAELRSGTGNEMAVTLAPYYRAQIFGLNEPDVPAGGVAKLRARWDAMHGGAPVLAAVSGGAPCD